MLFRSYGARRALQGRAVETCGSTQVAAPGAPFYRCVNQHEAAMNVHETKTFRSGRWVALRLPASLAIDPGEKMLIEQQGGRLTLSRARHRDEATRKLRGLLPALDV